MLFKNILLGLVSLSIALAYPTMERRDDAGLILARAANPPAMAPAKAPVPSKPPAGKPASKTPVKLSSPGANFVAEARKANNAPGREVPKKCKKLSECSCPKAPGSNTAPSTSCINGTCSCNNAAVNFAAKEFVKAGAAIGNAPITKAVGQTFKTIADLKQVGPAVAGLFLGPEAKAALKVAMNVIPDVGSSHIDDATKGVAGKILGGPI